MNFQLYKLAGILISALFFYLAVRTVDLSESLRVLSTIRPGWLIAATLVYLSAFPVRALRWRRILRDQNALSFGEVIVPLLVGYMANNVLPARAGELYRAHFLGRRAHMSRSGAMGSIVVERTFDGMMLIGLILFVLLMFPQTQFLGGTALATSFVFVALAVSILFYRFAGHRVHLGIDKGLGIMPQQLREPISHRFIAFLQGVRSVSTVRGCLEMGVYTILVWILEIAAITLVVVSFGVILPLSGYLLVYALAALSTMLPSGPGYIGPLQYAFVLGLGVFAVSQETALAVSVAAQIALLGPITTIGLALLLIEHLRAGPPSLKKPELKKERVG